MSHEAPAIVWALLAHVQQLGPNPPTPIAWAERPGIWTIVLEDGRKLQFLQELDPQPKAIPVPQPKKGLEKKKSV